MRPRCIFRGWIGFLVALCFPAHAALTVTETSIIAQAYASKFNSTARPTDSLFSALPPIADATVVAHDIGQFDTVRAAGFQSYGGYDAASASIRDSFAQNPVAESTVVWSAMLSNPGVLLPVPVPIGPVKLRFGFVIPVAGLQCFGCLDSPGMVTAEISAKVHISGYRRSRFYSQDLWDFLDVLTVSQSAGAALAQSNPPGGGLQRPTSVMTTLGSDVLVDYGTFSKIVDAGDMEVGDVATLSYTLHAKVSIVGYAGYADVSAFIADPFGVNGETVPPLLPALAQFQVNGASILAVPEPGEWALMLMGLALVLSFARGNRWRARRCAHG
jgi:hypothetical protein